MSCVYCKSEDAEEVLRKDGCILVKCKCGLAYWKPLRTDKGVKPVGGVPDYEANLRGGLADKLLPYVDRGRLLDYGGGTGCYSAPLRDKFEVYVLELDSALVEYGIKKFGIRGYVGDAGDAPWPDGHFDAAIMNQAIEHFTDPDYELGQCYRLLRKGGVLLVRTGACQENPDYGPNWVYLQTRELRFYTLPILTEFIRRNGFEILKAQYYVNGGRNLEVWAKK